MKSYIYPYVLIVSFMSCRKPYSPPAIVSPGSYLVVEATINSAGVTLVKLSKTVPLGSTSTKNPLQGATVAIQSNQNASYPLTEGSPGTYQSASLSLNTSQQYRLSVKTPDGEQYYSTYQPVVVSPPIDSVGFTITAGGIQLYVNTHDATDSTKYFRWDYYETWQFHSKYYSEYITNGKEIVPRTPQQMDYFCYATDTADNISLYTTAHLSQSVVNRAPLTNIVSTSEKLETEYSIQVNQYAITADAYTFWSNLKENSQNLGSIFDPLPSEIPGNIHNANNGAEPVLGYVSVCAIQTKRAFIYNRQLPNWEATYPYACHIDTAYFAAPLTRFNEVAAYLIPIGSVQIPTVPFYASLPGQPLGLAGYYATDADCEDCTVRGTITVPAFWQ